MAAYLGDGLTAHGEFWDHGDMDRINIPKDFKPFELCYNADKFAEIIFRQKEYLTKTRYSVPAQRPEIRTELLVPGNQASHEFMLWWRDELQKGFYYFEADLPWFGENKVLPVQIVTDVTLIKVGVLNKINVIMRLLNFDIYAGHSRIYDFVCGGTITCETELVC